MPLWTKDGGVLPDGITFYRYSGNGLLAFPTNVGEYADAIQAKNPLIIMAETPTTSMNARGFLLPLSSSGNLIFTDTEKLQAELERSLIHPYILEVERIESK